MNLMSLLKEMGIEVARVASCNGGEYHSRCPDPACGGKDRFCCWPEAREGGRYWCRRCLRSGDAIQFCRDFMGLSFQEACQKVGERPQKNPILHPAIKQAFIPKNLMSPSLIWDARAMDFIRKSHNYLMANPHLLDQDKDRGLSFQSIVRHQLGWNDSDVFESKQLWDVSSSEGGSKCVCLPKGIVIPSYRDKTLVRVKIRRHDWTPTDKYSKYQIVAGGINCPVIYGDKQKPLVIVEAELDAILVQQFAQDLCCCIALGGANVRPDIMINDLLRSSSCILFALDFDDAGKKAFLFWRATYSHLRPWPVPKGKSPGDAYSLGVDIRRWIESGLK